MKTVTPTLINSWRRYMDSEYDNRKDFLNMLAKVRTEPNKSMSKGIALENIIRAYSEEWLEIGLTENLAELAKYCEGGIWQERVEKKLGDILLYGVIDVISGNTLYDIKYTANYEIGKYNDSIQHLIYMYCAEINNFGYLISDFKYFWKEDYSCPNGIEDILKDRIHDFFSYLETDKEAKNLYNQFWIKP